MPVAAEKPKNQNVDEMSDEALEALLAARKAKKAAAAEAKVKEQAMVETTSEAVVADGEGSVEGAEEAGEKAAESTATDQAAAEQARLAEAAQAAEAEAQAEAAEILRKLQNGEIGDAVAPLAEQGGGGQLQDASTGEFARTIESEKALDPVAEKMTHVRNFGELLSILNSNTSYESPLAGHIEISPAAQQAVYDLGNMDAEVQRLAKSLDAGENPRIRQRLDELNSKITETSVTLEPHLQGVVRQLLGNQ